MWLSPLQNAAGLVGRTEKGQRAYLKREISLLYKKKNNLGKGSGGEHWMQLHANEYFRRWHWEAFHAFLVKLQNLLLLSVSWFLLYFSFWASLLDSTVLIRLLEWMTQLFPRSASTPSELFYMNNLELKHECSLARDVRSSWVCSLRLQPWNGIRILPWWEQSLSDSSRLGRKR